MTAVMENAPRRRRRVRRPLWRLELACGHTAFSLPNEPHQEGLARFCYACDRYVRIDVADERD